jgi:hypothetical protein
MNNEAGDCVRRAFAEDTSKAATCPDAPDDATQLVFFTDDPSFIDCADVAVEEMLCWIVRDPPAKGQLWIGDPLASIWGDWGYAVVTTGHGRILTAVSSATGEGLL